MKSFILVAATAAALAVVSSAQAGVNLVVNGDFSSPVYAPGTWSFTPSGAYGWRDDSDSIEIGKSTVYGLSSVNAAGQNLEVNANSSQPDTVYQDITGLKVGAEYIISYLYGGRAGSSGAGTYLISSFGGTALTTNSGHNGVWQENVFHVIASATTERLSFFGATSYCGGTCGNEIANVSVTAAPEPATWAMMLAGFGALAFAGHRRKVFAAA